MTAYLIANVTVTDPGRYEQYRAQIPAVLAQYGGRYIIRGGAVDTLEGNLAFDRAVVIEFPSIRAAKDFYHSPEYAPLLKLRTESTVSHVALVEGCGPP